MQLLPKLCDTPILGAQAVIWYVSGDTSILIQSDSETVEAAKELTKYVRIHYFTYGK